MKLEKTRWNAEKRRENGGGIEWRLLFVFGSRAKNVSPGRTPAASGLIVCKWGCTKTHANLRRDAKVCALATAGGGRGEGVRLPPTQPTPWTEKKVHFWRTACKWAARTMNTSGRVEEAPTFITGPQNESTRIRNVQGRRQRDAHPIQRHAKAIIAKQDGGRPSLPRTAAADDIAPKRCLRTLKALRLHIGSSRHTQTSLHRKPEWVSNSIHCSFVFCFQDAWPTFSYVGRTLSFPVESSRPTNGQEMCGGASWVRLG